MNKSFAMSSLRALLGAALLATTAGALAQAEPWPTRPVKLLVAFPPGTPGDVTARLLQPGLQEALGQPVVVDNKPGAGGNIGAQEVARATDGHTFLVGPDTMFTINPHLYRKLAFKPMEDLVPVTWLGRFEQTLACNPAFGVKTVQEFVAKARSAPFSYASGGPGVPGHMAMELLLSRVGADLTHVPYRGPAPAMQDVLAGVVPCGFLATPVVAPNAASGKLNALAVSAARRSAALPAVPTVAETVAPGFDASFYETLSAPRSTPPAVRARLQREIERIMNTPQVKDRLQAAGLEVMAASPEASTRLRDTDNAKWGEVNQKVKLQLD